MSGLGGGDSCPNCGEPMAADQRYCLNCGHRRGEPRLPFMDAVTFMESMNAPGGAGTPPPPSSTPSGSGNRWNANAALIAGVATLVLAIGVGFLIGRSGHENGSQAAAAPQVIKVEGGGGGGGETEAAAATSEESESTAGGKGKGAKGAKGSKSEKKASKLSASEVQEGSKQEEERAKAKTDEALHTKEGIELETEVEVGGKCQKGAAGCSEGGEFTGEFFGE